MRKKSVTCEAILRQRITVNKVIRYLEAIPAGERKSSDEVLFVLREWVARNKSRADERKAKQEESRAIHPTIIARASSKELPTGVRNMTIKIKPMKE